MRTFEKDRHQSLWEKLELPRFHSLQKDIQADVCIVGGGLCGVSTAYQLGKRGFKVVLVESSHLGSGQSGRTTAHLATQLEDRFDHYLKQHSHKNLELYVDSLSKAIDTIEDTIIQENISCEFKRIDGYLFLGVSGNIETLKREVELGKEFSLNLELIERVPGFPQLGAAIKFPRQAQFHPLKYLAGLIRASKELDVEIFEDTHISDFKNDGEMSIAIDKNGHQVKSKFLVVTTDTPVNNRFYLHSKQAAYRTYAITFKQEIVNETPLLWDTSDPYHYIRQEGDKLIVGGQDHRTGQTPDRDPFIQLEHWARGHFAGLSTAQERWSGQVFQPYDGVAFIGKNPGHDENVFVASGFSGAGMTQGTVASLLIPDLIEGKKNLWMDLYSPSRFLVNAGHEFLRGNANTAVQYVDWIKPAEVRTTEEIPIDHGCLMRQGLSKSCVYHGPDDDFEKKSAVCTHLGGIVHWNDFEKTWDCPCHGSRFNVHGKVIEGPAHSNLMEC